MADALIGYNQRPQAKGAVHRERRRPDRAAGDRMRRRRSKPRASPRTSPKRCAPAVAGRATSRSSIASTPCRGPWSSRCAKRACPIRSSTGWSSISAREIKDVLAYLHLINNPRDDNAFLRVINMPPRGIGKSTIGRLARTRNARGAVAAGRRPRERPDRVAQQARRRRGGQVRGHVRSLVAA